MNNILGYYFLVSVEDSEGHKVDYDIYCKEFTPINNSEKIGFSESNACNLKITPNHKNVMYFRVANNKNKYVLMEDSLKNGGCINFYHLEDNEKYRIYLELYKEETLLLKSNFFDFIF